MRVLAANLSLAVLTTLACGGKGTAADAGVDAGLRFVSDGGVTHGSIGEYSHVTSCSDATCGGPYEPPVGGNHCGTPLSCRVFTEPQPRCSYVHNLEHGHAVLAYRCPQGCPELVVRLQREFDDRQSASQGRRLLVTPDPALPRRFAAMVWNWSYLGDDWDDAGVAEVLSHQDLEAPEAGLGCSP